MDTVTEARMAIAIARKGTGDHPQDLSIDQQALEVERVKRAMTVIRTRDRVANRESGEARASCRGRGFQAFQWWKTVVSLAF